MKNDPLNRAYASKTDAQLYTSLSTKDRPFERPSMIGPQIFNAIVDGEFTALTATQAQRVRDVFGLSGDIDIRTGTNARNVLINAFGPGTVTRTNLQTIVSQPIARMEEIGCPDLDQAYMSYIREINNIHPGHP